jgi:hypothetical protein
VSEIVLLPLTGICFLCFYGPSLIEELKIIKHVPCKFVACLAGQVVHVTYPPYHFTATSIL